MNSFVSKYMQYVFTIEVRPVRLTFRIFRFSRNAVADGGTIAEEVIATIRTAQAFGTQNKLSSLYDVHARAALTVDLKAAVFHGMSLMSRIYLGSHSVLTR